MVPTQAISGKVSMEHGFSGFYGFAIVTPTATRFFNLICENLSDWRCRRHAFGDSRSISDDG